MLGANVTPTTAVRSGCMSRHVRLQVDQVAQPHRGEQRSGPGYWEDNGYPVDAWIGGSAPVAGRLESSGLRDMSSLAEVSRFDLVERSCIGARDHDDDPDRHRRDPVLRLWPSVGHRGLVENIHVITVCACSALLLGVAGRGANS